MSMSAKRLGEQYDISSQVVNMVLKDEGYLSGEPGNYSLTDKGESVLVREEGRDNGWGGSAFKGWNWFEWPEDLLERINITPEKIDRAKEALRKHKQERKAASEAYWNSLNVQDESAGVVYPANNSTGSMIGRLIVGLAALGVLSAIAWFQSSKASEDEDGTKEEGK